MLEIEPVLESAEIQGNILEGFNKDFQAFLFLCLPAGDEPLDDVRAWIRELPSRLTWLPEVSAFKRLFRERAAERAGAPVGELATVWMNVAFGPSALGRLVDDYLQFDPVFRGGLASASSGLGDPSDRASPGHPVNWLVGGTGREADIILMIAADREDELLGRRDTERTLAETAGMVQVWCDIGRDLARWPQLDLPSGLEHFGFKDGVSQPGVRGRLSHDPADFLTRRTAKNPATGPEFSTPGQPLICVGEFVLGYPRQSDANPRGAAPARLLGPQQPGSTSVAPSWGRNGSFLVYRRLRQNVPAFNQFLESQAALLQAQGMANISSERLGAMLVGRWRSGAPILRAPDADDPTLGGTKGASNDFGFQTVRDPADGFRPPVADLVGDICPAASHIRKVNPRDLNTDQGGLATSLARRLLRRGIPYGPPLQIGAIEEPKLGTDRGLLFLSFQTSIGEQFEFLQETWANDQSKPTPQLTPQSGHDLIIGQTPDRKRFAEVGPDRRRIEAHHEWVIPTGGGYFFAPSRDALHAVLGGAAVP